MVVVKNISTAVVNTKGADCMLELEQIASELQPYEEKLNEMGNSL